MDRRLIERTIEIANQSQVFGSRAERPALDSSPLWGAGRVEDTYNPPLTCAEKGHARGGRSCLGGSWSKVRAQARAYIVCATSVKAALDQDWDQVTNRQKALSLILQVLDAVDPWVQTLPQEEAALAQPSLKIARAYRRARYRNEHGREGQSDQGGRL